MASLMASSSLMTAGRARGCAPFRAVRSVPAAPRSRVAASAGRRLCVNARAELNQNNPLSNITGAIDGFFKRYDVLSTGAGALVVTGYCVYVHGQDPWTALSITFTSTVVALVANELLFCSGNGKP